MGQEVEASEGVGIRFKIGGEMILTEKLISETKHYTKSTIGRQDSMD